jgi:hypothetical protein
MGSLAGPKARREPAGEAKPDVCVISDGEAGACSWACLDAFPSCAPLNLFLNSISIHIDNKQYILVYFHYLDHEIGTGVHQSLQDPWRNNHNHVSGTQLKLFPVSYLLQFHIAKPSC